MNVRLRKNNSYIKSPALQRLYSGMGPFLGNGEPSGISGLFCTCSTQEQISFKGSSVEEKEVCP